MQEFRKLDKETLDKGVQEIRDQGYTIFENVMSPEQADHYRGLCNQVYEDYAEHYVQDGHHKNFHGNSVVKMIYNVHNKHKDFLPVLFDENAKYVNDILLKEGSYKDSEPYQLHLSTARGLVGPAAPQQLHIDSNLPGPGYVMLTQVFWALTDMTDENGATCVVPGSHKNKAFAEDGKHYDEQVVVNCPKGSMFIVDGGLWHGSSEKTSDVERWVMVNGYSRWFFRPTFDHTLNTPKHVYDTLSDEQKTLLGFKYRQCLDEFTRTSRISPEFEWDDSYTLPNSKK